MPIPHEFETELTKLLGIRYPIMCAGMGHVTGAELAAAVSNAGGIGTIGAIGMSPEGLRAECKKLRGMLEPGDAIGGTLPYGVDLLLPQVGGNARKTNKDYTGGQLEALVDVMIDEKVPLFVCAVGIPPVWVVEKLHANGTLVMNMAGLPRHVEKALETGVDIICASGTEGGAHTGDVSTLVLVPQCADMCKGRAVLVGAGGIFDGRGVAACMALGAQGCWIGTRFLATWESNSTEGNKTAILEASSNDTRRIEIYSGRPLRVIKNKYNDEWAANEGKMRELLDKGIVPVQHEIAEGRLKKNFFGGPPATPEGFWNDIRDRDSSVEWDPDVDLTQAGQCIGAIDEIKHAADLVEELMDELIGTLHTLGNVGAQVPQEARL